MQLIQDGGYVIASTEPNNSFSQLIKLLPDGTINTNCSLTQEPLLYEVSTEYSTYDVNTSPSNVNILTEILTINVSDNSTIFFNVCPGYLPGNISNSLRVTKSGNYPVLTWQPPGTSCIVSSYGIYRGDLPITTYNHAPLSCGITSLTYYDISASGNHYYIVVPNNPESEGSYGSDYPGNNERPSSTNACKQKNTEPCF